MRVDIWRGRVNEMPRFFSERLDEFFFTGFLMDLFNRTQEMYVFVEDEKSINVALFIDFDKTITPETRSSGPNKLIGEEEGSKVGINSKIDFSSNDDLNNCNGGNPNDFKGQEHGRRHQVNSFKGYYSGNSQI